MIVVDVVITGDPEDGEPQMSAFWLTPGEATRLALRLLTLADAAAVMATG